MATAASDVCLVVIPGSPYAMKAMCALESRGLPYTLHWLELGYLKSQLPPPHLVPVMVCDGEVVTDSTDILKYIDAKLAPEMPALFSDAGTVALEEEMDEVFSAYLYFFIFCDEAAWMRSMRPKIAKNIPHFLQILGFTPEAAVADARERFHAKMSTLLGEEVGGHDGKAVMEKGLAPLLLKYNTLLQGNRFLHAGDKPSAADCALYGFLERVVGDGGMCGGDSAIVSPLPDLLDGYPHLQCFYKAMRVDYPMVFKGKRRASDQPKLPLPGLYGRKPFIPDAIWKFMLC